MSGVRRVVLVLQHMAVAWASTASASGASKLWGSARLLSRPVALWELRPFFDQRDDRDMQRQLGLDKSAAMLDQARLYQALGASITFGIGGSLALQDAPLPDTLRLPLSAAVAGAPFALLGLAVARPDALRVALSSAALLSGAQRRRLIYHEAGHFLVGHLAGLRVAGYSLSAGSSAVRFTDDADARFRLGGTAAADAAVDAIACVSMAGLAAEVVACGSAEGGLDDLTQLRTVFAEFAPKQLSKTRAQDERIRWATLMALTLLTRHRRELDTLAAAFERGASVDECIAAVEGTAAAEAPAEGGG